MALIKAFHDENEFKPLIWNSNRDNAFKFGQYRPRNDKWSVRKAGSVSASWSFKYIFGENELLDVQFCFGLVFLCEMCWIKIYITKHK